MKTDKPLVLCCKTLLIGLKKEALQNTSLEMYNAVKQVLYQKKQNAMPFEKIFIKQKITSSFLTKMATATKPY